MHTKLIPWLLDGDVSIQYQVHRDLLAIERSDLQMRIETEGWGKAFLSQQKSDGNWGMGFYQPKWISTHYTLLDLKYLGIFYDITSIKQTLFNLLKTQKSEDGGINPARTILQSDVCVNGMFLNYACYFRVAQSELVSIVDFILSQQLPDGGFNCRLNRSGAIHSSVHSTLSILEGIHEYTSNGYTYRKPELLKVANDSEEFLLRHKLYQSCKTGKVIDKKMLMLSYPSRWYYDILRALDYFQLSKHPFDERMMPAIEILLAKRRNDSTWPLQAKHPGLTHFEMEKAGKASRWNTLRALRVLKHFNVPLTENLF